uniref:Uncharacterized protein n=1 Tax=Arundo donax TaxID=35708 RepID=A0A0A9DA44_ARUDO
MLDLRATTEIGPNGSPGRRGEGVLGPHSRRLITTAVAGGNLSAPRRAHPEGEAE